jgi:NADH-quinone oxidoreductase subunit L
MVVVLPILAALIIGLGIVVVKNTTERWVAGVAVTAAWLSWMSVVATLGLFVHSPEQVIDERYHVWFTLDEYAFELGVLLDRLSLTMMCTTGTIVALVASFSRRYLHREPGFSRYFLLLSVFGAGMQLLAMAGSLDVLFMGWELIGVASALLIAFFHRRPGPVRGALRAMITYRISDVGLIVAAALLHQLTSSSEFGDAFHGAPWPYATSSLSQNSATIVSLCLLFSAVGKSALFPLGGWLPRAMEGPTPSSALFYGALSIHAGVYLLLRAAPLLEHSPIASSIVVLVGVTTALHATLVGRTQADIKNALAYATATQVGVMLIAVGLHYWTWALVHLTAHACLRLYQLLRAPSALRDAQVLRAALADDSLRAPSLASRVFPPSWFATLQRWSFHRFFIDETLDANVITPVIHLSAFLDRFERRVMGFLDTPAPPVTDNATTSARPLS